MDRAVTSGDDGRPEGERDDAAILDAFRERQRVAIAEALIELVRNSGFSAVNVSDLARAVGMSRKTFYKYFASIEAALIYTQKMILTGMRTEREPRQESGLDRFMGQLRQVKDFAVDHPERMIFVSFFDFAVKNYIPASDREEYNIFTVHLIDDSIMALLQGQEDGSIDPELPAFETTIASTNAVLGLAQRCLNGPVIANDTRLLTQLIDTELNAWEAALAAKNS
ncbi:TetR/AcrR family transcriptional regulator [Streptomyces niveus]|uniref:TetR/AcrR family transcriptional regulator n=1 Tax=Streptomyces niveus TaxID=193462 RepID=UPI00367D2152